MRASSAVLVALLLLASAPACAGQIRGTVRVAGPPVAERPLANPYPGRASALPQAGGPARGDPMDAVVYLDRVPAAAESALATGSPPRLAQKGQSFVPRVLPVRAGEAVEFPNLDPIYHTVFSASPARRFDLGKYPRGQSRQVRFPRPGLVNVYCDIHSNMEAFILVLPHGGFVRPGPGGGFVFPDLPAGRYRVTAWHPDLPERSRDIEVPARGAVTCDFDY